MGHTPRDICPQRYERASLADMGRFIEDPAWAIQQKLDGVRCLVRVTDGRATFHTHGGRPLAQAGMTNHVALLQHAMHLDGGEYVLDGELLANGHLWLFDCPLAGSCVTPESPLERRLEALEFIFKFQAATHPIWGDRIHIAPTARTAVEKAAMWSQILDAKHEGCVAKRLSGPYHLGASRTRDVIKVKLVHTADVVVTARNTPNRDGSPSCNASVAIWADGELVPAGRVTMIGKPDAQAGQVIELEYMNFQEKFYQPVCIRIRHDKTPEHADDITSLVRPNREVIA